MPAPAAGGRPADGLQPSSLSKISVWYILPLIQFPVRPSLNLMTTADSVLDTGVSGFRPARRPVRHLVPGGFPPCRSSGFWEYGNVSTVVRATTLISGTPVIPILGFQIRLPHKLEGWQSWQNRPEPAAGCPSGTGPTPEGWQSGGGGGVAWGEFGTKPFVIGRPGPSRSTDR